MGQSVQLVCWVSNSTSYMSLSGFTSNVIKLKIVGEGGTVYLLAPHVIFPFLLLGSKQVPTAKAGKYISHFRLTVYSTSLSSCP